jgi:hypothetical protein
MLIATSGGGPKFQELPKLIAKFTPLPRLRSLKQILAILAILGFLAIHACASETP